MATATQQPTPPYAAYAGIMSTFLGGVALTGLLAGKLRRTPPERTAFDLAVLGLATFKAARTLARDEVTSFIREPFVEGTAPDEDEHAGADGRPAAGGRRARHVLALRRHLDRGGDRGRRRARAAVRADAQLVTGCRRRERLAAGRVRGADGAANRVQE